MDPWLKALQLHRQRRKRLEENSVDQEATLGDRNYEDEDKKTSSHRYGTTIERPSLYDETEPFAFEKRSYVKKRRKYKDFYERQTFKSQGNGSTSRENGKSVVESSYKNSPENAQEASFKNDNYLENGSSTKRDKLEHYEKTDTVCNAGEQVNSSNRTEKEKIDSEPPKEASLAEEQQKLLEELRRIEEELEKARAEITS